MEIRSCREDDLNHLYAISLATGLAGGDASDLYADPQLIGHIYVAPYAILKPELAWVAADDKGIAGFLVGVDDTRAWEDQLEREWWPSLRKRYKNPSDEERARWTPDERRIRSFFQPARTPLPVAVPYPAHVHLNLLPRLQGRGVGSRLLHLWLRKAAARGVQGIHVGVNRENAGGLRFWRKRGFTEIDLQDHSARTLWMGIHTGVDR